MIHQQAQTPTRTAATEYQYQQYEYIEEGMMDEHQQQHDADADTGTAQGTGTGTGTRRRSEREGAGNKPGRKRTLPQGYEKPTLLLPPGLMARFKLATAASGEVSHHVVIARLLEAYIADADQRVRREGLSASSTPEAERDTETQER